MSECKISISVGVCPDHLMGAGDANKHVPDSSLTQDYLPITDYAYITGFLILINLCVIKALEMFVAYNGCLDPKAD